MKKYENFVAAFENLKDIYDYSEPYGNVELTGLVGLFEVCFEQSWKAMKEILEYNGYNNYFMIGSDAEFGGRKSFFETHGNYTIYDYYYEGKGSRCSRLDYLR